MCCSRFLILLPTPTHLTLTTITALLLSLAIKIQLYGDYQVEKITIQMERYIDSILKVIFILLFPYHSPALDPIYQILSLLKASCLNYFQMIAQNHLSHLSQLASSSLYFLNTLFN